LPKPPLKPRQTQGSQDPQPRRPGRQNLQADVSSYLIDLGFAHGVGWHQPITLSPVFFAEQASIIANHILHRPKPVGNRGPPAPR
jgi:hypothetical protein